MSKRETEKNKKIEIALMNRIEEAAIITITTIVTIGMMVLERMTLREIVPVTLRDGEDVTGTMKTSMAIVRRSLNISTAAIIVRTGREMVTGIVEWNCRHAARWSMI